MWWVAGSVVIAAAVIRWVAGRNPPPLDQSERIQLAYQALLRRRRVAIASATDGPVLIRGKVSPHAEALTTPVTQRPCVFYNLRIDDLQRLGLSRQPPNLVTRLGPGPGLPSTAMLQRRDARPFHVTDETGTARVEFEKPEDVSFFVTAHLSLSGRKLRAATELHHAVLELGVTPFGPIGVEEAAIFVGDEVTVAGVGMRDIAPDGESIGHRNPPMRYVIRAGTAAVAISRKKPST
jgi:hypothetical protein